MTEPPPSALVFLQPLADRRLRPAALLLPGTAAALAALAAAPGLPELAAATPCLLPAHAGTLPPEAAAALEQAGCRPLPPGRLLHTGHAPHLPLAPGIEWIAGDWPLQPPAKSAPQGAASRVQALRLLQLVTDDAATHELEAVFRQEPMLSYQLLRLVNALPSGSGRTITSFAQAILLLGRRQLRRWVQLTLFAARQDDVRAPMLLARVSLRARTLELLAAARGQDKSGQEQAFMAGMFSALGALFDAPLEEVLRPLALDEPLRHALLRHEGQLGALLHLVRSLERTDDGPAAERATGQAARQLRGLELSPDDLAQASVQAAAWMFEVARDAGAGAGAGTGSRDG